MCGIFFAVKLLDARRGWMPRDSTTKPAIRCEGGDLEIITLRHMYTETSDALVSKSLMFEISEH